MDPDAGPFLPPPDAAYLEADIARLLGMLRARDDRVVYSTAIGPQDVRRRLRQALDGPTRDVAKSLRRLSNDLAGPRVAAN